MLPLLAHEVRPCLVYGEAVLEVDEEQAAFTFNIFDTLPTHTVAAAYLRPINTTGHNASPLRM
jgi:hypothetical protein